MTKLISVLKHWMLALFLMLLNGSVLLLIFYFFSLVEMRLPILHKCETLPMSVNLVRFC